LGDTTTVTSLVETGHENGHDGYGYTFSTTSDFANGAWTTTGSMTTIGNGTADWWYVGSYTFTQDSSSAPMHKAVISQHFHAEWRRS
jgi:hypothetical protein